MSNEMTKRQRLQQVLERHGAKIASWPEQDLDLVDFLREDAQAGLLFREAQALDLLLDRASLVEGGAQDNLPGLQKDILADFNAVQDERQEQSAGTVLSFPPSAKWRFGSSSSSSNWATAMALAACFAFGIYLGGFGVGDWTLDVTGSLATLSGGSGQEVDLADYVLSSGLEEDLL